MNEESANLKDFNISSELLNKICQGLIHILKEYDDYDTQAVKLKQISIETPVSQVCSTYLDAIETTCFNHKYDCLRRIISHIRTLEHHLK